MNLDLSQSIATLIGALKNCCYRNALLALLLLPQCFRWRYSEGWLITNEWPVEHGWLLTPIGEIVDPTLALFGQQYAHARYYPGASFTSEDVTSIYQIEQLRAATHIQPLSYLYRFQWAYSVHEAARLLAYASH